ncbi:rod shape-determining protein MreD [Thetidibacter halocola]|uniref:Rod shape-determining protein MreD n=1 Tax=Thetidibacter halocola TaxID=2827239 RepID=A0A8J7WEE0_9RHOB|nr:rod shape-determining protein MreD [Thetidibacter halocola]MBS0125247.1 rod shape-determining protein MreD [Thetidibacter halocola]
MAERAASELIGMRLAYLGLVLGILFVNLLPLQTVPAGFAGPDLLVALTLAWALRRPDYVPALSIAGALLLADLLLGRPPGLWAALVLIAAEWMKRQERRLRDGTFVGEWLNVAGLLLVITIAYRLVLGVLIVAPGTLFLAAMQYGMTVLAYPFVVAVSYIVFGVRHNAPGEFDPMGRGT